MRDKGLKNYLNIAGDKLYDFKIKIFPAKKTIKIVSSKHKRLRKNIFLTLMLALPVSNWLLFWLYTNFSSILLAFQLPTGGFTFTNFSMFWDSLTSAGKELNIAIRNTMIYFGSGLFIKLPMAMLLGYFLFKRIKGFKLFRVIFFLPGIISDVVLVAVFKDSIKPWGPFGFMLETLGIGIPDGGFLGNATSATSTIVFYSIFWIGAGTTMLLYSSAMSRIPDEIFESARLEGCKPFKELFSIIIPLIFPTISTTIILNATTLFTASGPILLMTNGNYGTTTISFWIFVQIYGDGFSGGGNYNIVSAAGVMFTAVGLPFVLIVRRLLEKVSAVEY